MKLILRHRQQVFLQSLGLVGLPQLFEALVGQQSGLVAAPSHNLGTFGQTPALAVAIGIEAIPQSHELGLLLAQVARQRGNDVGLEVEPLGQVGVDLEGAVVLESGVLLDVGSAGGLVLVIEADDLGHLGHLGGGLFDGRGIDAGPGGDIAELGPGPADIVAVAVLQRQIGGGPANLVPLRLFAGGQGNGLVQLAVGQHPLDPYGGVGGEPQAPFRVEQFRGTDEAEAALLDEFVFAHSGHAESAPVLAPNDRIHQPHVAGDELILGGTVVGHESAQIPWILDGQVEVGLVHGEVGPFLTGNVASVLGLEGRLEIVQFRSLLDGPGQFELLLGGDALVTLGDGTERLLELLAAGLVGRLGGSGDGGRGRR